MSHTNLVRTSPLDHPPSTKIERDVDRMGEIKAQIADLNREFSEIKNRLINAGVETADGRLFRVRVTNYSVHQIDYRAVVSDLKVPQTLLDDYTTLSKRQRVTVSARS